MFMTFEVFHVWSSSISHQRILIDWHALVCTDITDSNSFSISTLSTNWKLIWSSGESVPYIHGSRKRREKIWQCCESLFKIGKVIQCRLTLEHTSSSLQETVLFCWRWCVILLRNNEKQVCGLQRLCSTTEACCYRWSFWAQFVESSLQVSIWTFGWESTWWCN